MTQREILVTHALPYANGPLHIGHMLGYIQSDIWVRARRMAGDTVHFVAADDVHGTPIMLAAEKAGMAPEEFIQGVQVSHERDFADFSVAHDYYYTTHSAENKELAELVYARLREGGHIAKRSIRQLYDPLRQMFLPDRYVKGICPNCGTPDQYGDNCENCGATYAPTDLKGPRSVLSGATPELRDSEHYFFKVGDFTQLLRDWLGGRLTGGNPVMHSSVAAKLKEWLDAEGGVRDWDISRDAPYFGFPIPDAPGKFFYVWLDAPIGYLASFKKYCASEQGRKNGLNAASFDEFMREREPPSDDGTEMHHFIGKDIVNFHGLFWPAMLKGAKLRTPTALHVNGYLTVNGEKMSKSRGTFVMARTYLDAGLNPDYLRYYFATMLTAAPTDVDLDLKAFEERVNSHLVGKWVNIASRCAGFIEKYFEGRLASSLRPIDHTRYDGARKHLEQSWKKHCFYQNDNFAQITRDIVTQASYANQVIEGLIDKQEGYAPREPWKLVKDPEKRADLHEICTLGINFFRLIAIYLAPILPQTTEKAEAFLGEKFHRFSQADDLLLDKTIRPYEALITRVDPKQIESMIEASKDSLGNNPPQTQALSSAPARGRGLGEGGSSDSEGQKPPSPQPSPPNDKAVQERGSEVISIDDFAKLDLRIGKVLACEFVDGSDKLLRFELDAGELGKRQIFSGIRAAYGEPEKLIGRNVVFIANLAPRKMRFGVSEGMILSAGSGGDDLHLLDVDGGAQPGATVK